MSDKPYTAAIPKKGQNADRGRLADKMTAVDRNAARGIPGSAIAADGREHIRGFPCPSLWPNGAVDNTPYYLTADRRMWCPIVNYDLKAVGRILDSAFGTRR